MLLVPNSTMFFKARNSSLWTIQTMRRNGIASSACRCQSSTSTTPQRGEGFDILFVGRDEFSCLVLQELWNATDVWKEIVVVTNPDLHVGRRGKDVSISPLRLLAEKLGRRIEFIPPTKPEFRKWVLPTPYSSFSHTSSPSCPTVANTFTALVPPPSHVLITASFGRILTQKHLSHFLPSRRLNVHPSLLPHYRGPAPIQHALLNAEKETGVCVIEMLNAQKKKTNPELPSGVMGGIDAGAVWGSKTVPQPEGADFSQMRNLLGLEGGKLLVQVLRDIRDGQKTSPVPQTVDPDTPLRPAPMIHLQDAFVNPQKMTAQEIIRIWKAIGHQRPICTHFLFIPDSASSLPKVVQMHQLHLFTPIPNDLDQTLPPIPGSSAIHCWSDIINRVERALLVRCMGGGIISVPVVKPEGRPLMSANEFWNGARGQGKQIVFLGGASLSSVVR